MNLENHPIWETLSPGHRRRYRLTAEFLSATLGKDETILDLGEENDFSRLLKSNGYQVHNTSMDLDREPDKLASSNASVVTAFEILEHLLNPLSVLEQIPGNRLYASVPLRLWFSPAYRHPTDPRDRHFHEFEAWQFDWLLDHAGWTIIRKATWTNPVQKPGLRPLLRLFTPRWYVVEAIRKAPTNSDR